MATILVTGASRGLGLEVTRQLAAAAHDVIAGVRDAASAQRTMRDLGSLAGSIRVVTLDVTDADGVRVMASSLAESPGRIDVVVNNAGASFDGFDASVAERTVDTNYRGAARVTDAVSPLLPRGGRIVMVSSGMGELSALSPELRRRFADPALSRESLDALVARFVADVREGRHAERGWPSNAYRVSKVAMNALTRILARELADREIAVNAVCPGWVRTDLGGRSASRSVEQGATGIVWAATRATVSGGFFRDAKPIAW